METRAFSPDSEESPISESNSRLLSEILKMIYYDLRIREDSRDVFTESLRRSLSKIGSPEDSADFRKEIVQELIDILKRSNPDRGDLVAAATYLNNLIPNI